MATQITTLPSMFTRLRQTLSQPIDNAFLGYFRIAFGLTMLWEVWRYFDHNWIERQWMRPTFFFPYPGFHWVKPWPGNGMHWHFVVMAILALFIMIGFRYRISATLFFFAFTYIFLLDETTYLNHFYLICLLSFLLIFLPAERAPSIDSLRNPELRSTTAPKWCLWLLRFQIGVPYFFGGIAKLNPDWLRGEPFRMWLSRRTDFPVIGSYFTDEWMVGLFVYGGLMFDLLIVPLLLWRKTRPLAYAAALFFHVMNSQLFSIGIFPWFMIAATVLFFPPDLPGEMFSWKSKRQQIAATLQPMSNLMVAGLIFYVVFQLVMPFRHLLYPGDVSWTEEGHRFAWRMKLRTKSGTADIYAYHPPSDGRLQIELEDYLTREQIRQMSTKPYMLVQFAHHLRDVFDNAGYEDIEIRAEINAGLNGRDPQPLIDPTVDLSAQPQVTIWHSDWILPLESH